jgi:hypothetical protein
MAKTKALSAAEQSQVRADIVQKIQDINAKLNEDGVRDSRDQFIERFIICETAYKIVLKKYLQVNNKYISDGNMIIQLTQVKTALKKAGYTLDKGLMERLFSGSGNYTVSGQKSARLLRNGIEHEMNVDDLQEVHDRLASLVTDMDSFITWIQV